MPSSAVSHCHHTHQGRPASWGVGALLGAYHGEVYRQQWKGRIGKRGDRNRNSEAEAR